MASIHTTVQPTLQIGEVAKRTALSVDAIRFYEGRKLLPTPFRSVGSYDTFCDTPENHNLGTLNQWQVGRDGFSGRIIGRRSPTSALILAADPERQLSRT